MRRAIPKLYSLGLRFPGLVLLCSLIFSLAGAYYVRKLQFVSDFISLLPQNTESVKNLHRLEEKFGSYGYVVLTVEAPDPELAKEFAQKFAVALEQSPDIAFVDYRQPVEYFKQRQWLYLETSDLQEMERRIDRSLELETKGVSPVFNNLMDFADEENRPDLTFADIRKKYEDKFNGEAQKFSSGSSEDPFEILWVKPKLSPSDIEQNRRIMAGVRQTAEQLRHEAAFASVQVGYTGEYQNSIEQVDLLIREITWVSLVVTALLLLVLLLYFRRFSAALLIGFPLMLSVLWTMALVYFFLGHLNMITGFGAAILGGLGSDYGIFLMTRYYNERALNHDFKTSCRLAFGNTGRATFGSMVTTVAAFGALLFSNFRVFVELGIVGALGLVMNYVGMMLLVPSLLALGERWKESRVLQWLHRRDRLAPPDVMLHSPFFQKIFTPKAPWLGLAVVGVLVFASLFSLKAQTKIYFEDGQMDVQELPANKLYSRVSKASYGTLKPGVLLVEGQEAEAKTVEALDRLIQEKPKDSLVFHKVLGISSFLPKDPDAKKVLISRITDKLAKARLINRDEKAKLLASLRESMASAAVTLETLPLEVKRLFEAKDHSGVYAVLVYQSFPRTSSENIERYHSGLEQARSETGLNFAAVDSVFVQWDLIQLIEREAPRGMGLILIFFAGFLFWTIRPAKRALLIFLHLLGSLVLLSGAMWLLKIHLNVMNIAVIPIVLGTGIDCFIHFSIRFDEESDLGFLVKEEMPAIFVSSLTSIIGFGGLVMTSSLGLRSIGWVSMLGLSIVTLACALIFPRCLVLESSLNKRTVTVKEEALEVS